LVDFPVVNLLDVIQHEYFGHGWRARDYGFDPVYSIDVPLPYGDGGGETGITFAEFNSLTLHQKAAWETGGVESTEIMGRILGEKVFACQMMDYREALLYLMAYQDLTLYLYTIRDESEVNDSHDMRAYLLSLREIYGTNAISYNDLRGKAWINLLDPLTWFSATSLWQYLWSAEKCQEIPVIHWGYGSVLPAIRYSLAPYGPEYGLYSYFCLNHRSGVAYMRYGETEGQTSWAIGVKANDVIDIWDDIRLGGRLDFWWQPKLNTSNPADPGSRVGMAASARATYCLGETWGATMELGGKTWGYLPGESLDADFILRLGVTFYTD
ncbi:MAG: hypothetical protein KDK78_03045, partial [Chlamydiia bacterium]|nr:hypothetical protein [Chlamydiia bacterium]